MSDEDERRHAHALELRARADEAAIPRWLECACDSCGVFVLFVFAPELARCFPALCARCAQDPQKRRAVTSG